MHSLPYQSTSVLLYTCKLAMLGEKGMCMCCLKTIIDCDIGMSKIKLETRETHNSQEKVLETEQYQTRELRGNTN